jgi:hypothetical protein
MGASSIDLGKEHATEGKAGCDEREEDAGENVAKPGNHISQSYLG